MYLFKSSTEFVMLFDHLVLVHSQMC